MLPFIGHLVFRKCLYMFAHKFCNASLVLKVAFQVKRNTVQFKVIFSQPWTSHETHWINLSLNWLKASLPTSRIHIHSAPHIDSSRYSIKNIVLFCSTPRDLLLAHCSGINFGVTWEPYGGSGLNLGQPHIRYILFYIISPAP